jgi:hypothetical protein
MLLQTADFRFLLDQFLKQPHGQREDEDYNVVFAASTMSYPSNQLLLTTRSIICGLTSQIALRFAR